VLFKLRQLAEASASRSRAVPGLAPLDAKLRRSGARAAGLPFDRTGARDAVGLGLWIASICPRNELLPGGELAARTNVYSSYLPADGASARRDRKRTGRPAAR
jgi:hypothetical protein